MFEIIYKVTSVEDATVFKHLSTEILIFQGPFTVVVSKYGFHIELWTNDIYSITEL